MNNFLIMPYTIAIFPEFSEYEQIQKIREKYDPSYNFIKTHIALVYYFSEKPSKEKLNKISKELTSFKIKLNSIKPSLEGNFVFLKVTSGKEHLINLNNILYKELQLEWDKPFPYEPHITLANLSSKEEQNNVLRKIEEFKFDISIEINSFSLLEVSQDLKKIVQINNFRFS